MKKYEVSLLVVLLTGLSFLKGADDVETLRRQLEQVRRDKATLLEQADQMEAGMREENEVLRGNLSKLSRNMHQLEKQHAGCSQEIQQLQQKAGELAQELGVCRKTIQDLRKTKALPAYKAPVLAAHQTETYSFGPYKTADASAQTEQQCVRGKKVDVGTQTDRLDLNLVTKHAVLLDNELCEIKHALDVLGVEKLQHHGTVADPLECACRFSSRLLNDDLKITNAQRHQVDLRNAPYN